MQLFFFRQWDNVGFTIRMEYKCTAKDSTKNGKIVSRNRIRAALDVNTLPVQDLSIFEDRSLHRPMMGKIYRMVPVETQRGCPYACRFCNSPEKNEFYDMEKAYLKSRMLESGDVILLASGGHGFEVIEDLEMIEVKQGPHIGEEDKTRFKGIDSELATFEDL